MIWVRVQYLNKYIPVFDTPMSAFMSTE